MRVRGGELVELEQHPPRVARMDERHPRAVSPRGRVFGREAEAGGAEPRHLRVEVVHLQAEVMHTGSPPFQEPADRRVGAHRFEQLDPRGPDGKHRDLRARGHDVLTPLLGQADSVCAPAGRGF